MSKTVDKIKNILKAISHQWAQWQYNKTASKAREWASKDKVSIWYPKKWQCWLSPVPMWSGAKIFNCSAWQASAEVKIITPATTAAAIIHSRTGLDRIHAPTMLGDRENWGGQEKGQKWERKIRTILEPCTFRDQIMPRQNGQRKIN